VVYQLLSKRMPPTQRPLIFQYLDYRAFLTAYVGWEKQNNPRFSLRTFSKRIMPSLSSSGLLSGVLKGKKNLGSTLRTKFARALQLKAREAQFFELLVRFNQAGDIEEKSWLLAQMSRFRHSRAKLICEGQYRFFTQWYYPVVWNYFGISQKRKLPADIAAMIQPRLTPTQVEEAIRLLLDLGLLKKMANGYAVTENHLTTEPEFRALEAQQYNEQFLGLAVDALRHLDPSQRQFGTMVFSASIQAVEQIKEKMAAFQEEAQEIIDRDTQADGVYTLGFQLFPNTRVFQEKKGS
jgi:uncharacterized protein (TIGR02147 family)